MNPATHQPETDAAPALEAQLSAAFMECNARLEQGEFMPALECLNQAARLAPGQPDVLNHRARLLGVLKQPEAARRDFTDALASHPQHVPALAGLARWQLDHGAHPQAETLAQSALALDPQNQEAADVLAALKELAAAKSRAERQKPDAFFTRARQDLAAVEPPPLSEWHLKNSRIVRSREDLLRYLPVGGVCAEVGTQTGAFARRIMERVQPERLHIFDLDFKPFDTDFFAPWVAAGRVVLHAGDSSTRLAALPDHSFDVIYIDGDHSYQGVVKNLAVAQVKLKPGGWIVCNDYTLYSPLEQIYYGVYRAVNELCWHHGFEIIYLGLHPWGYHDVALRRMPPEELAQAGQPPDLNRDWNPVLPDPAAPPTGEPMRFTPQPARPTSAPANRAGPNAAGYMVDSGLKLAIGSHSYIHDRKLRNPSGALTNVTIGKFCSIATGLSVVGYDHHSEWISMYPFLDDGHRPNWPGTHGIPYPQAPEFGSNKNRGDISIGHDVWIGCDVKIFKGISIGNGAVIGAGSLVNKSIAPYTVVAGIPARPIRKRFADAEIELLQKIRWWDWPEPLINRYLPWLCSSRIRELEQALADDPDFQCLPADSPPRRGENPTT